MVVYKKITKCRSCGNSKLTPVLDLGKQYLVSFQRKGEPVKKQQKYPLKLMLCHNCLLVQLEHSVNRELLFRDYHYKSGINQTMKDELADIVKQAVEIARPQQGDTVVDIGANDGTLLSHYDGSLVTVAYEPSRNFVDILEKKVDVVLNRFFSISKSVKIDNYKAKIITAIAMFYDLDNPNKFLQDIKKTLAEDGLFIIQMNYLESMLKNNAFDNICHEHTCYYNLKSIIDLLNRNDLEIFDATTNDINGGSIRLYIKHTKNKIWPVTARFDALFADEFTSVNEVEKLRMFAERIWNLKYQVFNALGDLHAKRKTIYGYGASTRGAVILQYFGVDRFIQKIADRNPEKWGTKYMGKIPVISEFQMRIDNPDVLFVLPWFFEKEFVSREMKEYLKNGGGTMIFPLPELHEIRPLHNKVGGCCSPRI